MCTKIVFFQNTNGIITGRTVQHLRNLRSRKTCSTGVSSHNIHPTITVFGMCIQHTACNFYKLSDMTDKQGSFEAKFFTNVQRISNKVGSKNCDFRINTNVLLNIIRTIIARSQQDIFCTVSFPLAKFYPYGINESLFAHRLHNPGCTQNGNATDNSESWIKCLFRKLFSIWNGDHNGETTVIVGQAAYFFEIFTNHLPGNRVDCSSTYRLI